MVTRRKRRLARGTLFSLYIALLLAMSGSVVAQAPEEAFREANAAYERGDYETAAEGYRSVLRYQIQDPRLEFNLANAEFRRGRLGAAILHYERARRLDPVDPDIQANLAYARSQTFDKVEVPEPPALISALHRVQDRLGPDRQAWVAVGLFWIIAAIVAWGLSGPGRWTAACGWWFAGLALTLALVAGSWYFTYDRVEGRQLAVVLAETVEVVAGPGLNNATLFTVHEGLTVEIRGELRQEWVQVSLPNGLNGWVPVPAIGFV